METRVFVDYRERIKIAVQEEICNFCAMIDCVDGPPALDYTTVKYGVKVRIVVELTDP